MMAMRVRLKKGQALVRRAPVMTMLAGVALAACTHRGAQASLPPHQPEPVAPMMMPVAVVPAPTTRAIVQGIVDSVLAAPMWRNARWGMLVVDAERGDTVLSHDADRLFMPASNQKLLTGAIAMERLGPSYRWRTPVMLHGVQRGHTFTGDVLVQGSGDPSISDVLRGGRANSAFDGAIAALKARGITRVSGRVRAVGDMMTGLTTGFGWAFDDFDFAYSAAVDELMYNEGVHTLTVRGARKVGAPAMVTQAPTLRYPAVRNLAVTRDSVVTPGARPAPLEAVYDSIGGALLLTGTIATGDSTTLTVSYRHPADAFLAALTQAFADSGIVVRGKPLAKRDTAARAVDTLTVIESVPMADVLRRMQKPSQNQIAELLFRTSGYVTSGDGSADSARAVGVRTLAGFGVGLTDAAYRDGSGLSRHDYLTPRAVVKVLDAMRRSPAFEIYRDALPIAGVDGTIANRMKGTAAQGNARAKTGTVDKARSLSGYVTTADGRLLLFSLLCNNFTVPTREVERVQDLLVTTLAARALGAAGAPVGAK